MVRFRSQLEEILSLPGSLKIVLAEGDLADFSPDGRWLLTRAKGQSYLWETRSLKLKREIAGETRLGAFSADGQHMAVYQPANGQIQVVEVETGRVVNHFAARSLLTGAEPIGASGISVPVLRFHPTRPELFIQIRPTYKYSEADDRYERMRQDATVYAVTRQAFGPQILAHTQQVFAGSSFDGRYQVGTAWGTTRVIDTATSKTVYRTKEYVKAVHFSRDSQYALLVTGKHSQVVKLPEGKPVRQFKPARWPNDQQGYSLPRTVWVLDRANNLLLDGLSGDTMHRLDDFAAPKFIQISLSPQGRYVAGIDHLQTLRLRDLQTGQVTTQADERFGLRDKLVFSPDEKVLLVLVENANPARSSTWRRRRAMSS